MPIILQMETSTEVCSVAIAKDGSLVSMSESTEPNAHTTQITLLIQECLQKAGLSMADIDAVAISHGPGSYTSLRVGAATAKGICYTMKCPLIALDSLTILASGVSTNLLTDDTLIITMIDARRMEVYAAVYDQNLEKSIETEATILTVETYTDLYERYKIYSCGSGATKHFENFPHPKLNILHTATSASFMTKLALKAFENKVFEDLAYYSPNYFKAPNITKSTKKWL